MRPHGFVIAAPASGSGKTTITLGLMAALTRRGLTVQPFKCGPDFIDPGHHTRVCGRASRNLDGWMLPAAVNRALFQRHASTADVSIVEGVMGLFDGAGRASGAGSTAAMASLLDLPVILVIDTAKMAASAAAIAHGFATFDASIRVAGVICNKIASAAHYDLLRDALARVQGVAPLGYLPRDAQLHMPERYLGLVTAGEETLSAEALTHLADLIERHIDVDAVIALARASAPLVDPAEALGDEASSAVAAVEDVALSDGAPRRGATATSLSPASDGAPAVRIGVARDRAFCFYYDDNFTALEAAGAVLVPFSPLGDAQLPAEVDALYFGGGYPELWAEALVANQAMQEAVRGFIAAGGAVYAECGGLMYLSRAIQDRDGRAWPMIGALPFTIVMTDRLQRFGYVEVTLTRDSLLGPAGTTARGHSFHYSRLDDDAQAAAAAASAADDAAPDVAPELAPDVARAYHLRYTLAGREEAEGFTRGNLLASYVHIHFLSNPDLAPAIVSRLRRVSRRTSTFVGTP